MKILHITDSHGTVKSPESRTDLYYLTFLRKFAEITYAVKLHKIDMVLHTGDLFHTSRVSNKFMGQVAEIIKGWGVPFYVVPGNHDIDGYTIDTIDQTSLGLLAKTGTLTLLTRDNPIRLTEKQNGQTFTVAISGQEYYSEIDTGNESDFEMQQDEADMNILAIHGYIADTKQHPNIRCTYPKDIITDADIILSGHYHRSFVMDVGDTAYYNPGSMLRVEMTEYNKTHTPQYGVLEIELDNQGYVVYDYKFHQFRVAKPSTTVFDYNSATAVKKHSITLENFKTSIANTMQSINVNLGVTPLGTITNTVIDYCTAQNYDAFHTDRLKASAAILYNNASVQTADEDAIATKGFVPSNVPVKLKSIDIENFQSHENTHVDFNSGLNVIVGESNNGKTSILRAIDWVTDNQPLGTDFIMTGKNYCKVRITYDNDTFIERYRTLKDTGYYRVGVIQNGQETYQEYKGFTNNVPVEVMNVHQMPKICVTKSIETHLNKMSQLERPFLITDNTNEKAAAIGKITGTDIIDTAIKNVSSEIASDKKVIKANIKLKEDFEATLIDINPVIAKQEFYKRAINVNTRLHDLHTKAQVIHTDRIICNDAISNCTKTINNLKVILDKTQDVHDAELLRDKIVNMMDILKDHNWHNKTINELNDKIVVCTNIVAQEDVLVACSHIIDKVKILLKLYSNNIANRKLIEEAKNTIANLSNITQDMEQLDAQQENIMKMIQGIRIYSRVLDTQSKIQEAQDDSSNALLIIGGLESELNGIENDMQEFVLSNKICPCCGQKITTENVTSIINNFRR